MTRASSRPGGVMGRRWRRSSQYPDEPGESDGQQETKDRGHRGHEDHATPPRPPNAEQHPPIEEPGLDMLAPTKIRDPDRQRRHEKVYEPAEDDHGCVPPT